MFRMSALRIALPEVPVLETPRLRLRGHRLEDFADCSSLWTDPIVVRHITGKPSTREEVWARLIRYIGHWAALGYGFWVAHEKSSGRFVGELGFADFHRELEAPLEGPESGWALASWAHGRGFATEALQAVVAWGDAHFAGQQTVCIIATENEASIRVAERCGYRRRAGQVLYHGTPNLLFEREAGAGR